MCQLLGAAEGKELPLTPLLPMLVMLPLLLLLLQSMMWLRLLSWKFISVFWNRTLQALFSDLYDAAALEKQRALAAQQDKLVGKHN